MTSEHLAADHRPAPAPRAGRREWAAFTVLLLALLMVAMDTSVLFFAVPAINADLAPSGTEQLWIYDVYGFLLAGLLLTMGSLGDRIGRRRLLLCGAAAFGAASAAAAYATSPEMLIAARAVLGVGGATLMPSTMGLIRVLFRDAKQRARAIGAWTAVLTGGIALGSVVSGVLVEHYWWGSVFLVNLPAMLLLLILAPLLIPEYRDPEGGKFDLPSVPLSLAAVLPLVWALKEIPGNGMRPSYALALAAGLVFLVLFVRRQRTTARPMVPPALLKVRGYRGALVLGTLAAFGMMGSSFFTTQYLQSVLGLSALQAALWSLVPSVPIGAAAPVVTALVQRGVPRGRVVAAGFLLSASGMAVLGLLGTDSLALVLTAAGLLAVGIVTALSQLTDLAMGAVPVERASTASALWETGQEFGGALGLATLGSLATTFYRAHVTDAGQGGLPDSARETLGGAVAHATLLGGERGAALLRAARDAFVSGMHVAAWTCAALFVLCAAGAVLTLRDRGTDGDKAAHTGPASDAAPVPVPREAGPAPVPPLPEDA
ncbi:putative transmembrane efflux protein [Streptomyces sp. Tu6071]|uniref:MFS transporter n=1 Tax=Streptomyces sp. Tu6071 TaxID=355249 RepID=UPI00020E5BB6|nr:MFS transporter [Streptomyces sp. Tu6071]EGJ74540.1 putative transmembrane efflux protein [Streptomyces sp. Tu6071]